MFEELRLKIDTSLERKLDSCCETLHGLGSVVVALSGGVDSSFLLAAAAEVLGPSKVIAGMAVSTIFPQHQCRSAREVAHQLHVELVEIATPQLADASFTSNPADRCYYCKSMLLSRLKKLAAERGFAQVVTGSNYEGGVEYRPGARAEAQMKIRCPLREAGLTKKEVRTIARYISLPTLDALEGACLADRVPYGQEITPEKLSRIERAEDALRKLGFEQLRVRDHGTMARIELPADEISAAAKMHDRIVGALRREGYTYVALDMQGYGGGSTYEPVADDAAPQPDLARNRPDSLTG